MGRGARNDHASYVIQRGLQPVEGAVEDSGESLPAMSVRALDCFGVGLENGARWSLICPSKVRALSASLAWYVLVDAPNHLGR